MKTPAIRRFGRTHRSRHGERGVTMVLVALAMIAIIAMAALSIDVITLYLAREEAQRAADGAALAAARVISISGLTGDPTDSQNLWQSICNGSTSPASQAATAVATQSAVGGTVAAVLVTYSAGGTTSSDCAAVGAAFGVNPLVTVQITRTGLPTFFSRIWGNTGNNVSASATAEALNPSASDLTGNGGASGTVTPVQPSCVKPWMVPNQNPRNATCNTLGNPLCLKFVSLADGAIQNFGFRLLNPASVIGETFNLFADCGTGAPCTLVVTPPNPQPQANAAGPGFTSGVAPPLPNLEYVPGAVSAPSVAVPSCSGSGSGGNLDYQPAVAGCDQSTVYQCGVQSSTAAPANSIDLSENPGGVSGDTAAGVECLINQSPLNLGVVSGQDSMITTSFPFQITAGSANANVALRGGTVTSSNSIMSLPIYDDGTIIGSGTTPVTIVGFLQVFVNWVNTDGSLNVTVLNVAGCGNNAANRPVTGSSPVPVRLVTPP
jgi:Flp pilus assembly protein TadG